MMNEEFSCFLFFDEYSIEFFIKQKESIEFTNGFNKHDPDFVFAVSEVWLKIRDSRFLIIPSSNPGNLLEEFKDFSKKLSNPASVKNLENIISRGKWCTWMRGYWDRLNNDCNTADDEALYDLLIPLSVMESRVGHVAIYRYNGIPTIEVATRSEDSLELINVWCEFDPEQVTREVYEMGENIAKKILCAL